MKKITLVTLIIVICTIKSYSQAGAKWAINGNAVNTGDFIGTTNNEPFIIKANNIVGLRIKPNGQLIIKSLDLNSSGPSGVVLTDGQGIISRLDFNSNINQFLSGNGTWQNMPKGNWLNTGNDVYWTAGNVGIGIAPSPIFKLDILGDARISNNLVVGGGIIISQKVEATSSLKTDTIHSVTGETKFTSKVILKNQFQVDGTTLFNGTVQAGNLYVSGTTNFGSPINAQQGLTFDGVNGINFTPATSTSGSVFRLGAGTGPTPISSCIVPTQDPWFYFGGRIQLFDPATNVALTMGSDGNTASIDASGNNGLKINYYCHNNTIINAAWALQTDATGNTTATQDGGTTIFGAKTDFRKSIKIGYTPSGAIDLNTSIEINQNEALGNGIKLNTYNNALKFITISNTNFATSPFTVFGGGNTVINAGFPSVKYFVINDASGSGAPKESFTILGSGRTDISASTKTDKYFVINDVSTLGSTVESFVVNGDGSTKTANLNVVGDVTISNFTGASNRNVMADATGKLITVAPTPIGSLYSCNSGAPQWSVGGDNMGMFTDPSVGTCDYTDFILKSNNINRIRMAKNGKIYFGAAKIVASHPSFNSEYQFDGIIACKELVVIDPTKWADFVFEKNYKLLSLNEVETYYHKNKHLPSIPSEAEVKENGINTAEMDALLLQKIEELTIYIVQQQKDIEELKKQIKK